MMIPSGDDGVAQCFANRPAQFATAALGSLLVLLGIAGLVASSGMAVIYFLIGVYTVWRAMRSSCVVVSGSGVTTRSMVRTRRYAFSDLRGVDVAVGRTGFTGVGREYLLLRRADGQKIEFKELNCPPPKAPESTSIVRRAADCINKQLPQ